jgi:phosphate transport system ATP-binding protein
VAGTAAIEHVIGTLRQTYTFVVVTRNVAQTRRASDDCIFMLLGDVVEQQPMRPVPADTAPRDRDVC